MTSQTLIIGDIQGCYEGMKRLLEQARFNPNTDKLYAVGDLVARGEDSLSTLQYLQDLGSSFSTVLGNHDLHLMALSQGIGRARKSDNLDNVLACAQLDTFISWLRTFPLAMRLPSNHILVHAGLYPKWSTKRLLKNSDEISQILSGNNWATFLRRMYGNKPDNWDKALTGESRYRFIVNACTRMRFVYNNGRLDFASKSSPANATGGLIPWFRLKNNKLKAKETVVFGHWAALEGKTGDAQFIGLDTGYVWGNRMTAMRLEDGELFQVAR